MGCRASRDVVEPKRTVADPPDAPVLPFTDEQEVATINNGTAIAHAVKAKEPAQSLTGIASAMGRFRQKHCSNSLPAPSNSDLDTPVLPFTDVQEVATINKGTGYRTAIAQAIGAKEPAPSHSDLILDTKLDTLVQDIDDNNDSFAELMLKMQSQISGLQGLIDKNRCVTKKVGTASSSAQVSRLPAPLDYEQHGQADRNVLRNAAMVRAVPFDQPPSIVSNPLPCNGGRGIVDNDRQCFGKWQSKSESKPSVVQESISEISLRNAGSAADPFIEKWWSAKAAVAEGDDMKDTVGKSGPGKWQSKSKSNPSVVQDGISELSPGSAGSGAGPGIEKLFPRTNALFNAQRVNESSPSACERLDTVKRLNLRVLKERQDCDSSSCSSTSTRSSAHTEPQDDVNEDPYLHGTESFWGAMVGPGLVEDLDAHQSDLATEDVESKRLSDDFIRHALHIVDAYEAAKGLPSSSDWMHPLDLDYEGELAITPIKLNGNLLE